MAVTLAQLRRFAVARSLFKPTTLKRAIEKLGFVQADPIRAPARAQDLTLRHRVRGLPCRRSRAALSPGLPIEEDFFVNYGYLLRHHPWTDASQNSEGGLERGARSPGTGAVGIRSRPKNRAPRARWTGISRTARSPTGSAARPTPPRGLLDEMHYRGLLRVARRDSGTRVYAVREAAVARHPRPWTSASTRWST